MDGSFVGTLGSVPSIDLHEMTGKGLIGIQTEEAGPPRWEKDKPVGNTNFLLHVSRFVV